MARYTEYIIKFLDGELPQDEMVKFTEQLNTDTELQNEYLIQTKLHKMFGNHEMNQESNASEEFDELDSFASEAMGMYELEKANNPQKIVDIQNFVFNSLNEKTVTKEKVINRRRLLVNKNYWIAAASVVLFVVAAVLLLQKGTAKEPTAIYAQNFTHYSASSLTRDGLVSDELIDVLKMYEQKKYQQAINGFKQILAKNEKNALACFFCGLSYMELSNNQEAIVYFTRVFNIGTNFTIEAHWYAGLAYLKMNKKQDAKKCFEFVKRYYSKYQQQAGDIANELE